jgi:RNA polymerase sigma-70 factor (ECF subfamily)
MVGRTLETTGFPDGEPLVPSSAPTPSDLPPFREVYHEYFDFVWASARRLGIQPSSMDDLVQEVFLVVHSKLYTVEKKALLRSWIYSVVRRTASNHRRAKRKHGDAGTGPSGDGEALSREPTPHENAERSADLQLLMSLLNQMDLPKREIFALVDVEDFSVPEAAELLGIPLNTAYSRLRVARQNFEAALARHEARTKEPDANVRS